MKRLLLFGLPGLFGGCLELPPPTPPPPATLCVCPGPAMRLSGPCTSGVRDGQVSIAVAPCGASSAIFWGNQGQLVCRYVVETLGGTTLTAVPTLYDLDLPSASGGQLSLVIDTVGDLAGGPARNVTLVVRDMAGGAEVGRRVVRVSDSCE